MENLVHRLRKRAEIRRSIKTRKSVQEGAPDRISDLLEEAATEIERLRAGLDDIASWGEGPEVNGTFDEPGSAAKAREVLAENK